MKTDKNKRPGLLNAAKSLATFQMLAMAAGFLRNVVLARLIGIEDMGIAAILGMTVSTIEQIADSGINRFLVQAPDGDSVKTVGTAQLYALGRGVVVALLLLFLSSEIASAFSVPQLHPAFAAIAIIPLMRGAVNLDVYRLQREMAFKATNWMELAGQLVALVVACVCGAWLHDYRAALLALISQCLTIVVTSHCLARRAFRLELDVAALRSLARFGLPLVLNGGLLALTINGDRIIMASSRKISPEHAVALAEFAAYSVGYALIFTLTTGLLRVATSAMLPALTKVRSNPQVFQSTARLLCQSLCGFACCITFLFAFFGQTIIVELYGNQYRLDQTLLTLLAVSFSLRALRSLPNSIAMSNGNTWNTLAANCFRSLALPLSLAALTYGYGMHGIVWANVAAELLAVTVCALLIDRSLISGGRILVSSAVLYGPLALVALLSAWYLPADAPALRALAGVLAVVVTLVSFFFTASELRTKLAQLLAKRADKRSGLNFPRF